MKVLIHAPTTQPFKRAFITIELLIGITLGAIILTTVFGLIAMGTKVIATSKQQTSQIDRQNQAYQRLKTMFLSLDRTTHQKTTLFHLKDNNLLFKYDNGVDPDPYFSNHPVGILSLAQRDDGSFALVLFSYPDPQKFAKKKEYEFSRYEVVIDKVQAVKFRFFSHERREYLLSWEPQQSLPDIVEITLTIDAFQDPLVWSFPVAVHNEVYY